MRKLTENQIVLASHNKGKLKEITLLLKPFGITVISANELGLTEPEETENTYAGNARITIIAWGPFKKDLSKTICTP